MIKAVKGLGHEIAPPGKNISMVKNKLSVEMKMFKKSYVKTLRSVKISKNYSKKKVSKISGPFSCIFYSIDFFLIV